MLGHEYCGITVVRTFFLTIRKRAKSYSKCEKKKSNKPFVVIGREDDLNALFRQVPTR